MKIIILSILYVFALIYCSQDGTEVKKSNIDTNGLVKTIEETSSLGPFMEYEITDIRESHSDREIRKKEKLKQKKKECEVEQLLWENETKQFIRPQIEN